MISGTRQHARVPTSFNGRASAAGARDKLSKSGYQLKYNTNVCPQPLAPYNLDVSVTFLLSFRLDPTWPSQPMGERSIVDPFPLRILLTAQAASPYSAAPMPSASSPISSPFPTAVPPDYLTRAPTATLSAVLPSSSGLKARDAIAVIFCLTVFLVTAALLASHLYLRRQEARWRRSPALL